MLVIPIIGVTIKHSALLFSALDCFSIQQSQLLSTCSPFIHNWSNVLAISIRPLGNLLGVTTLQLIN